MSESLFEAGPLQIRNEGGRRVRARSVSWDDSTLRLGRRPRSVLYARTSAAESLLAAARP